VKVVLGAIYFELFEVGVAIQELLVVRYAVVLDPGVRAD
jgi:hypothetical protein